MSKGAAKRLRSRRKKVAASAPVNTNTVPQLLTIARFCSAFVVSQSTARRMIRTRQIASVHVGERGIRIPASELDRLINQNITPAVTA